ncbi:MAG: S46 family peptidase [Acidobacteriota bacterium]
MNRGRNFCLTLVVLAAALASGSVTADEGMWTLNGFPAERFEAEYGFAPSDEWLDHVRQSAVRFNSGGSASFVSANGLVITNHHVGLDCIQKLSSAENDYVGNGFVARTLEDETVCPDLELNVLDSIERVTERVRGAVSSEMDAAASGEARRQELTEIEQECKDETGLRCDVITLYRGGEYDLYRYRRYTDVRLAFAPEAQFGFYGGDPDNFDYPRFSMDFALFRVYEDGAPAAVEHYLTFDPTGPDEGEVTFVAGNPGSTGRLNSVAQLEYLRDESYPNTLLRLLYLRDAMYTFAARGEEQQRIVEDDLLSIENGIKAISGYLSGLLDEELMARKVADEKLLREKVAADSELTERVGDPWGDLEKAIATSRTLNPRATALGGLAGPTLASLARRIVRLTEEIGKPNTERLREFRESALPSVYQRLYSSAPIYPEYEQFRLEMALRYFKAQYGPTHPLVQAVFGEETPDQLAKRLVEGTQLAAVEVRKTLVEGGVEAVKASKDPMIQFALKIDDAARAMRKKTEDEVDAIGSRAGEKIADTYFEVHGKDTYPDATFTLRISYGQVKGYEENGEQIPWVTTFGGLFERAEKFDNEPPYDLPTALAAAKDKVDMSTRLNLVSTHDIIGGNSGSPLIDREGRFVGIIFDGNLYSLPNRFVYSSTQARSTSVHSAGILETLEEVYPGAEHLADELLAGKR